MGSKKTLPTFSPFAAVAVSGTTTYTSPSTFVANLDNVGPQVVFVGTMTGAFSVLVSNDDSNYDALTFVPALSQPAGSNLKYAIDLNQLPWPYIKFQYVNSSGSGTLTVTIFAKDLN
jgi:hypothetical protein